MKTYELGYSVWLYSETIGPSILSAFAHRDAAEKWARQLRNQINRDNKRGDLHRWPVDEVRVKDEAKGRWKVAFMTAEYTAKRDAQRAEGPRNLRDAFRL